MKYERLNHYPALTAFDRDEALKRLRAYEMEERRACQPWLTLFWYLLVVFAIAALVLGHFYASFVGLWVSLLQIPAGVAQYFLYRRIRRRVDAKVAAELGDGRLWTCVECGYDLRASNDRCPECGAPVRVGPPHAARCSKQ